VYIGKYLPKTIWRSYLPPISGLRSPSKVNLPTNYWSNTGNTQHAVYLPLTEKRNSASVTQKLNYMKR